MSYEQAIVFQNVTKKYSKYEGVHKFKNFLDRIKNGQFNKRLVREEDFYALRDVSFTLKKGERLGIIGPNGAGKSTTLKLINQIAFPTSGKIAVHGKVGGMIELGSGFQNDLTGRENIYLSTAIQGYSRKETDQIIDKIIDISELENFIDVPIKRYSSGMKVRLGFAVVMASTPDVVLLDEVLAVGDAMFKKKSMAMIKEYLEGRTLVFVSHSMTQIQTVCERVIVLNQGRAIFDGPPDKAIDVYKTMQSEIEQSSQSVVIQRGTKRGFSEAPKISVNKLTVNGIEGEGPRHLERGSRAQLSINFLLGEDIPGLLKLKLQVKRPVIGRLTEVIGGAALELEKFKLEQKPEVLVSFDTANLKPGDYIIEITPEFDKQSSTSAVVVYKEKFSIVSSQKDTSLGLLDLDFKIADKI